LFDLKLLENSEALKPTLSNIKESINQKAEKKVEKLKKTFRICFLGFRNLKFKKQFLMI